MSFTLFFITAAFEYCCTPRSIITDAHENYYVLCDVGKWSTLFLTLMYLRICRVCFDLHQNRSIFLWVLPLRKPIFYRGFGHSLFNEKLWNGILCRWRLSWIAQHYISLYPFCSKGFRRKWILSYGCCRCALQYVTSLGTAKSIPSVSLFCDLRICRRVYADNFVVSSLFW